MNSNYSDSTSFMNSNYSDSTSFINNNTIVANTQNSTANIPTGNIVNNVVVPKKGTKLSNIAKIFIFIGFLAIIIICFFLFNGSKGSNNSNIIIDNSQKGVGVPNFAKTSCSNECGEATVGLYQAEDDDGTTYYYRGDVKDNYVKFGGFYWRIIRINGNGSIRMIYSGDANVIDSLTKEEDYVTKNEVLANGYSDYNDNYILAGKNRFNKYGDDNAYVGYKYDIGSLNGNKNNSTLLQVFLEQWYKFGIVDKGLEKYIDKKAGFCGDRSAYLDKSGITPGGGTGTIETYYGSYVRLKTFSPKPSFKCPNKDDIYELGVGLITADEVVYAGGNFYDSNRSYYLFSGEAYWTMSPGIFSDMNTALVLSVDGYKANLVYEYVGDTNGVRPVINVSSKNLKITGKGTIQDPYIFS